MPSDFIQSALHQLKQYKILGEEVLLRVPESFLNWKYNHENNSIAGIVKHMTNNMCLHRHVSPTHNNDEISTTPPLIAKIHLTRSEMLDMWNQGWDCLFHSLKELEHLNVKGPQMNILVQQLAHYPFHIGQIIYIEKMIRHHQHLPIEAVASNFFTPELIHPPSIDTFISRENIEDEPGNDTIL